MQTLTVGRGFTASWTVTLRNAAGAALTGVYAGTEPLDLVVSDLGGLAPATLTASSVAWGGTLANGTVLGTTAGAAAGIVTLTLDDADTDLLDAGPRGLSIGVTDGGERYEAFRATLVVEPRPPE